MHHPLPNSPFFLHFLPFLSALNLNGSSGETLWAHLIYATALALLTSSCFFDPHSPSIPQSSIKRFASYPRKCLHEAWKWIRSDTGKSDRLEESKKQVGALDICTTTCPSQSFFLPPLNLKGSSERYFKCNSSCPIPPSCCPSYLFLFLPSPFIPSAQMKGSLYALTSHLTY